MEVIEGHLKLTLNLCMGHVDLGRHKDMQIVPPAQETGTENS